MNRREFAWFMAIAMLALLVAVSAPAFPQEPATAGLPQLQPADPVQAEPVPPPPGGTQAAAEQPAAQESSTVESILRQQEELLQGQQFSYDAEGRRDPFQSLIEKIKAVPADKRPQGASGMLVTEIDLDGIIQDPSGGNLAFFTGSDNKGYFLRVGDAVYDGTLIAIDPRQGTVTFRQHVDDPRIIKPYRDVVKRLVPQQEESSNE